MASISSRMRAVRSASSSNAVVVMAAESAAAPGRCHVSCDGGRAPPALPSSCVDITILVSTHSEDPMPLNIRNETVNKLAAKLAVRKRMTKTEAVKTALENELRRLDQAVPLRER